MRVVVAVVALLVQCVALYWPSIPAGTPADLPGADKVVHTVLFAVATWALGRVAGLRTAVVLMVVQVVASETIQGLLLPHRSADILDAVADLVGLGIGAVVLQWPGRRMEIDGNSADDEASSP